ncbi:MAG: TetR/AcrR family transcriptional regulator [Anaerolineaceae bacterium]|nr:TetR/AcrR family transcriptional regulator [Anaerolineaceae bacterium]
MQQRSEETISQIMAAAIQLFSHSGYEAASVADICAKAGVSKGAFYHHFPSKQVLFLAIVDQWLQGIDTRLFLSKDNNETVPQTITRMARTLGFVFQQASGQLPMFMEFMVQASRDQAVWDATIAPYRRYHQQFAKLLEQGKTEGSIKTDVDVQAVSWSLLSLAIGILLQGVVDPKAADWDKVTKTGVQLILDSIQKE